MGRLLEKLLVDQLGIVVSLVSLMLWTLGKGTNAYNIDDTNVGVLSGAEGSFFGASVALWQDSHGEKKLAVGAPKGASNNMSLPLGNLYICSSRIRDDGHNNCSVVDSVPVLSREDKSLEAIEMAGDVYEKYGIGLGETLFTVKKEKSLLLVCAPRFPRSNEYGNSGTAYQIQPRGACFKLGSSEESPDKLLPYDSKSLVDNKMRTVESCKINNEGCAGFAQAGFSVTSASSKKGNEYVYLGGPSAFSSQGVIASMKQDGFNWKKVVASKVKKNIGSEKTRNCLEGWATVSGKFDGEQEYVATSSPGYDNYKGMVKIYPYNLKRAKWTIEGQDMGSGYGFSLATGDFNGDDKDDLAVAAPFASTRDLSQDVGKVIVYFFPIDKEDNEVELDGLRPWGRFGHAMVCLGDIDSDGFDDLAIGAPYAFEGQGAVYIYNGNSNGIRTRYSQEIRASSFEQSLFSFGYSLDGGLDIDGNGYEDLLVGAPLTDKAIFLRSAPVISLNGWIAFDTPLVSLEKTPCEIQLQNGLIQEVACFELIINIQYQAKHVSEPLPFRFDIKLDEYERIAFEVNHRSVYSCIHNVSHVTSDQNPLNFSVYIKPNVRRLHLLSEANATLQVSLVPDSIRRRSEEEEEEEEEEGDVLHSVISAFSQTSFSNSISFECPDLSKCLTQSNLILTRNSENMPLMVSEGKINVEISLKVENDTAYAVKLIVEVQKELQYLHHQSNNSFFPSKVHEKAKTEGDKTEIHFKFPSELPRDTKTMINFTFQYTPSKLIELGLTEFDFSFQIYGDTDDLDISDNNLTFSVPINSKVNLEAEGSSVPESVKANSKNYLSAMDWLFSSQTNFSQIPVSKLGPRITHNFRVRNRGPSPLISGTIVVGIPLQRYKLPLMYLVDAIETKGNIKCSELTLNPLNFRVESDDDDVEELAKDGNKVLAVGLGERRKVTSRKKRSLSPRNPDEEYPMHHDNTTREEEIKRVNCSSIPECEEIRCEVFDLMADDNVFIKINSYVPTGTLKLSNLSSVLMESSLAFYTTQKNVFLDGKQAKDDGLPEKANIRNREHNSGDNNEVSSVSELETTSDESLVNSNVTNLYGISQSEDSNASDSITAENTTPIDWDLSSEYYHSLESETTTVKQSATAIDVISTVNTDTLSGNRTTGEDSLVTQMSSSAPEEDKTTTEKSPVTTDSAESSTSDATSSKISTLDNNVTLFGVTEIFSSSTLSGTFGHESIEGEAQSLKMSPSVPEQTAEERNSVDIMNKKAKQEMPTTIKMNSIERERKKYDVVASTKITVFNDREIIITTPMQIGILKLIMGVTGALMLITCICALLYKVGFFKRKRLTEEQKELLEESIRKRQEREKYY